MRRYALIAALTLLAAACTQPTRQQSAAEATANAAPSPGAPGLSVLYGAVTVAEKPAPDGTAITVVVNDNACGSAAVRGGRYEVVVAGDAEKKGCGKPGDEVTLYNGLDGDPARKPFSQKAKWAANSQKLDLVQ